MSEWSPADLSRWKGTIGRLRADFEALANRASIEFVLVEGKPDFDDRGHPPGVAGESQLYCGDFGPCLMFFRIGGSIDDAASLATIAGEAGNLLDHPPPPICDRHGIGSGQVGWFHLVFDLAWQNYKGTTLRATRQVWFRNFHGPLDQFQAVRRLPNPGPFKAIIDKVPDPPNCWYSKLDDICRSSVAAIDILISMVEECRASNADRAAHLNVGDIQRQIAEGFQVAQADATAELGRQGRRVSAEDIELRKTIADRWEHFKTSYEALGYAKASIEHFTAWADDMPSDDHKEIHKLLEAHRVYLFARRK
jgi:hypothetical protein